MEITEALETIINARYGRDVRQAIHDGIKQAYEDAIKNGNANMEVSQARGSYPTLAERLTQEFQKLNQTDENNLNELTDLIADKINKGEAEISDFSQSAREYLANVAENGFPVVGEKVVGTVNLIDNAVSNHKISLAGVALPKTFNYKSDSGVGTARLQTTVFNAKIGDRIYLDNNNFQFNIKRDTGGLYIQDYRNFFEMTENKSIFLDIKKSDGTNFNSEEVETCKKYLYMTTVDTLTNNYRLKSFINDDIERILGKVGIDIPVQPTYKLGMNMIRIDTNLFSVSIGTTFTIPNDSPYTFNMKNSQGGLLNQEYVKQYTLDVTPPHDGRIFVQFKKNDGDVMNDTDIQYIKDNFEIDEPKETKATEFYVSPTGSDTNDGLTRLTPFATFQKAIDSGAKLIHAERGDYFNQKLTKSGGSLTIVPPNDDDKTAATRKTIRIINGEEVSTWTTNSSGYIEIPFEGNNAYQSVFIDKTKPIVWESSRPSYNVGLWQIHAVKPNNTQMEADSKLKPVLTVGELLEKGTFTFDGTKIIINPFETSETISKFAIVGDNAININLNNLDHLKLIDVESWYAVETNFLINRNADMHSQGCKSFYTLKSNGFSLDMSTGNLFNCEAYRSNNDGFNIHFKGTTNFYECIGSYNYDDGISHHEETFGTISRGEWRHNGKSGIAPTYGSRINLYNNISEGNDYNYYCDNTRKIQTVVHQGNISIAPRIADLTVSRYKIEGYLNNYQNIITGSQGQYVDLGV